MYIYYIAMEIYILGCINIFSSFYCLCITNMPHHSPTMNFTKCRNPSFGLATKARGCKVASQEEGSPGIKVKAWQGCKPKRKEARERKQRHWKGAGQEEARESPHTPGSLRKCEEVWGSEHSHSQGNSHFRRGSPGGLPKLQRASWRVKSQWIVTLLVPFESS
jgi:hypothetical protein